MTTTAEGVETFEQVRRVREEGLTEMQGYVFSPPQPLKEIARLFLAGEARAARPPEGARALTSSRPTRRSY
jgi:EAL domain-containing protein (putative c-di-GMP-specific phosphodiesterase class I)